MTERSAADRGTDDRDTANQDSANRDSDAWDSSADAWYLAGFRYAAYPLLAISLAAAMVNPDLHASTRWLMIGLSAAAVVWTFGWWYARVPTGVRAYIYFAGFLVLSGLLLSTDMLFFVYTITGFLHAVVLRPMALAFAGIFLSSVWLNVGTLGFPPNDPLGWGILILVIVVQSTSIGAGIPIQERMAAQHEKRRQTVLKLERALEENAELHAQLLDQARTAGASTERQRMAREIHDTLAQGLAGIVTQLEAADHAREDADRRRHLDTASRLARDSLAEARRTVHAIAPVELQEARLSEAIGQVAHDWSELNGVPAEVVTTGTPRALHPEVEVTLLRISQEALTNVAKHAEAGRVGLTLSYMEDVVTLDVRDDGGGFDPDRVADRRPTDRYTADERRGPLPLLDEVVGGFGITGMRQRAHRLAGRVEVESEPGTGTAISARVPAIPPLEPAEPGESVEPAEAAEPSEPAGTVTVPSCSVTVGTEVAE